jgi:hypothetical protein
MGGTYQGKDYLYSVRVRAHAEWAASQITSSNPGESGLGVRVQYMVPSCEYSYRKCVASGLVGTLGPDTPGISDFRLSTGVRRVRQKRGGGPRKEKGRGGVPIQQGQGPGQSLVPQTQVKYIQCCTGPAPPASTEHSTCTSRLCKEMQLSGTLTQSTV